MKMNVELDCTPEEARRFLGLPDVSRANDLYVDSIVSAMKGAGNLEQLQEMTRRFSPMGEMGMKLFQQFMESSTAAAFGNAPKSDGDKDR